METPPNSGPETFLPNRSMRHRFESFAMRIIATGGIIGIGVLLGALLGWADVRGWIIGLVVSVSTVLLAAFLWSSRTL